MPVARLTVALAALCLAGAATAGCEREARRYQELPASANRETGVRVGALEAGMPQQQAEVRSPYQDNAWGMGEGKRLYAAYNCAPCHGVDAKGGPGFPDLTTSSLLWGGEPDDVFTTIRAGINSAHQETRVSQMPAFGRDQMLPRADAGTAAG